MYHWSVKQPLRRTQIYLDNDTTEVLDRLAGERGTTRSDLIRQAAKRFVEQESSWQNDTIWNIVGLGKGVEDGIADDAIHHDEYLIRIKEEKMPRSFEHRAGKR